jgi:hypothetical protein
MGSQTHSSSKVQILGKLNPAKQQGLLAKVVLLWHDNGHTHITVRTVETLKQLHFDMLRHPPYSPDTNTLDYQLFRSLRDVSRAHQFASNQEVKEIVHV